MSDAAWHWDDAARYFQLPAGVAARTEGPLMGIDLAAGMAKHWRVRRRKDGTVTMTKRGPSRFWKRRSGKR